MELSKVEMGAVQEVAITEAVRELQECQLLLVGGGCGDISLG